MHTTVHPRPASCPGLSRSTPIASLVASLCAAALAGCGGGGDGGETSDLGSGANVAMIVWQGNVNGSTVLDADGEAFSFTTTGFLHHRGWTDRRMAINTTTGGLILDGQTIGRVSSRPGASGGQVLVMECPDGSLMNLITLPGALWGYTCEGEAEAGGTDPTAGYVSWVGSDFGPSVRDADDDWYVVEGQTRRIGFTGRSGQGPQGLASPVWYENTRVDEAAHVYISGTQVGSVRLGRNAAGLAVALLQCTDGRPLSLRATNGIASHVCVGTVSGGGGTAGTSNFVSFNGSGNGICILDATNDCFAVDATSARLSFIGPLDRVDVNDTRQPAARTFGNTRVGYRGGVADTLSVDGRVIATLRSVRLVDGSRGPALLCGNDRYLLDLFEDPARTGDALFRCTSTLAPG